MIFLYSCSAPLFQFFFVGAAFTVVFCFLVDSEPSEISALRLRFAGAAGFGELRVSAEAGLSHPVREFCILEDWILEIVQLMGRG